MHGIHVKKASLSKTYVAPLSRSLSLHGIARLPPLIFALLSARWCLYFSLQLGTPDTYKILSSSECMTLDGVDDSTQFRGVQKAFDTIGIEPAMQIEASKLSLFAMGV